METINRFENKCLSRRATNLNCEEEATHEMWLPKSIKKSGLPQQGRSFQKED